MGNNTDLAKVDAIKFYIVPFKEVYIVTNDLISHYRPGVSFDYREYSRRLLCYIFDSKPQTYAIGNNHLLAGSLEETECRSMLMHLDLSKEDIAYIEHRVLLTAIDLLSDYYSISRHMVINGFYWDIDENWDLILNFV